MKHFATFVLLELLVFTSFLIACQNQTSSLPTASSTLPPSATFLVVRDCSFRETARAWIDANENGSWDEGEQPLENVLFTVKPTGMGYAYLRTTAVSNQQGEAELHLFLAGCPDVSLSVQADGPLHYQLTTHATIPDDPNRFAEVFAFGFVYPANLPTPTPRPQNHLTCTPINLGDDVAWIDAIAIAPDDALWITRRGRVLRLTPDGLTTSTILETSDTMRHLAVAPDGSVWLNPGNSILHLSSSTWITHTVISVANASLTDSVLDIAVSPDNTVWVSSEDNGVRFYDPASNRLIPFTLGDEVIDAEYGIQTIKPAPDGTVWFFSPRFAFRLTPNNEPSWQEFPLYQQDETYERSQPLRISETVVDQAGNPWLIGYIASLPTLLQFNPTSGAWITYDYFSTGGAMFGGHLASLALAPDGSLWLGVSETGIMHFLPDERNESGGSWIYYGAEAGFQPNELGTYVDLTSDGTVWVTGDKQSLTRCVEE